MCLSNIDECYIQYFPHSLSSASVADSVLCPLAFWMLWRNSVNGCYLTELIFDVKDRCGLNLEHALHVNTE
jgi:hypothetical protein